MYLYLINSKLLKKRQCLSFNKVIFCLGSRRRESSLGFGAEIMCYNSPVFPFWMHTIEKKKIGKHVGETRKRGNREETTGSIPAQPSQARFICTLPQTADGILERESVFTSQLCFYLHQFELAITCVSAQERLHTAPSRAISRSLSLALILKRA